MFPVVCLAAILQAQVDRIAVSGPVPLDWFVARVEYVRSGEPHDRYKNICERMDKVRAAYFEKQKSGPDLAEREINAYRQLECEAHAWAGCREYSDATVDDVLLGPAELKGKGLLVRYESDPWRGQLSGGGSVSYHDRWFSDHALKSPDVGYCFLKYGADGVPDELAAVTDGPRLRAAFPYPSLLPICMTRRKSLTMWSIGGVKPPAPVEGSEWMHAVAAVRTAATPDEQRKRLHKYTANRNEALASWAVFALRKLPETKDTRKLLRDMVADPKALPLVLVTIDDAFSAWSPDDWPRSKERIALLTAAVLSTESAHGYEVMAANHVIWGARAATAAAVCRVALKDAAFAKTAAGNVLMDGIHRIGREASEDAEAVKAVRIALCADLRGINYPKTVQWVAGLRHDELTK